MSDFVTLANQIREAIKLIYPEEVHQKWALEYMTVWQLLEYLEED
tara:strand:- start:438 stop:572 length:135 start_codon:yes stop_codon:yes gene_type:complete